MQDYQIFVTHQPILLKQKEIYIKKIMYFKSHTKMKKTESTNQKQQDINPKTTLKIYISHKHYKSI
jgi:hypothetical protein